MSSTEGETIYERVAKLEDEVAALRNEIDILKKALRNKLARHEIAQIKKGEDITSIID
jgi:cell division protein FtsB